MSRPKTKGEPLSFRLSIEAYEELCRRAAKAGVSPTEHLIASLERSLAGKGAQFLKRPWPEQQTDDPGPKIPPMTPRHEVTDTFRPEVTKPVNVRSVVDPLLTDVGYEVRVPLRQFLGMEPTSYTDKDPSHLDELDDQNPGTEHALEALNQAQFQKPTVTVHEGDGPVIAWATGGSEDSSEPKFGEHPSWRLNAIGVNVCTACGEPKGTARQLCTGNPL